MAASVQVGGWRAELDALLARFGRLFARSEPRRQAGRYLEGLLGPVERKNGWQLAEHLGDARPWRTQRVLSHVLWDEDAARDLCALVEARFGVRYGETGMLRLLKSLDLSWQKARPVHPEADVKAQERFKKPCPA